MGCGIAAGIILLARQEADSSLCVDDVLMQCETTSLVSEVVISRQNMGRP